MASTIALSPFNGVFTPRDFFKEEDRQTDPQAQTLFDQSVKWKVLSKDRAHVLLVTPKMLRKIEGLIRQTFPNRSILIQVLDKTGEIKALSNTTSGGKADIHIKNFISSIPSTESDESSELCLQHQIINDVSNGSNECPFRWKINVLELTTQCLAKIIALWRARGFKVHLETLTATVLYTNSELMYKMTQELSIDATEEQITDEEYPFSPTNLRSFRSSIEQIEPNIRFVSLDDKLKQIFSGLQLAAYSHCSIRRFKFNVFDLTQLDAIYLGAKLERIGYRFFLDRNVYRSSFFNEGDPLYGWNGTRDLIIEIPENFQIGLSTLYPFVEKILTLENLRGKSFYLLNNLPLTRNLTLEEQNNLLFAGADGSPSFYSLETDPFISAIQSSKGMKNIASDTTNYQIYLKTALKAFLFGEVSQAQVATFSLLYSAIDQIIKNPKLVTAYVANDPSDGGQTIHNYVINRPEVPNLKPIAYHLLDHPEFGEHVCIHSMGLTIEESHQLFKALSGAPCSECQLFLIPLPAHFPTYCWSPIFAMINEISDYFFKPIQYTNFYPENYLVIPSFTIIREVLRIAHPMDLVDLQPIFGSCSEDELAAYKQNGIRPFQLAAPFTSSPTDANRFITGGGWAHTMYGIYLAKQDSSLREGERLALSRIAHLMNQEPRNDAKRNILSTLLNGDLYNPLPNRFGSLFTHPCWTQHYIEQVMIDMVKQKNLWRLQYGLTRGDLLPETQAIYDRLDLEDR